MIQWQWARFDQLGNEELYEVFSARQAVFVVEQNCPYQDADGQDQSAYHLLGWSEANADCRHLAAYLRVIPPASSDKAVAIGRILTTEAFRGNGSGRQLLRQGLEKARATFPGHDLYMSAQAHLQAFYQTFGFQPEGEVYDEDGIPHIAMYDRSGRC
ncbi:MAG: GNAT family N-acetyltransferase [Endozoicomonas sp.]